MRAVIAFIVTFAGSLLLIVWLSEELRILPRGPGWLLLCFALAGCSSRLFAKGGKAESLGNAAVSAVAEKIRGFAPPEPAEEAFWALAAREFESAERRVGLYAKAFAAAEGDESKAKALYIKARVAELRTASRLPEVSMAPNPSIERTASGEPEAAAHVER